MKERLRRIAAQGSVVAFILVAFEVMIMISPFAFFFYSVFNPIFNWLDQYAATKWLTTFFLPHMTLPPTLALKGIRVLGSVFFVVGLIGFSMCALQVYLGKLFKWGIASKGLYAYIRHPQYLFLGIWGAGMAILWPRFIVLALLSFVLILYYFLAKDEEKLMAREYGDAYRDYESSTGMFLPFSVERLLVWPGLTADNARLRNVIVPLLIVALVLGGGFICRTLTLHSLPYATAGNITLLPILPEDRALAPKVLQGIADGKNSGTVDFLQPKTSYLGYLMPVDYIMQGMIANTGSRFHLFKKHHTIAMVMDWVLHPFQHLRRPPSAHFAKMHGVDPKIARRHHCPLGIDEPNLTCDTCPYRRVILVKITTRSKRIASGPDLLSFRAEREPAGFIDVNAQTGEIINAQKVGKSTAWKDVPTPAI